MSEYRPVVLVTGFLLIGLAGAMLPPMVLDILDDEPEWRAFAWSALICAVAGTAMALAARGRVEMLTVRGAFVLTVASWLALAAFAALPFLLSGDFGLEDSFFEAMSGLTTTGATMMTGLDFEDEGILLWRAILQWIGGVGIVVTAIALLPLLRIGGMQLFRLESSDQSEKVVPRAPQLAAMIGGVYLGLTLACAAIYALLGMSAFDSIAHAMTTVATGGFSTSDASMGAFTGYGADIAAIFFMIAGASPFAAYVLALRGEWRGALGDPQLRGFLIVVAILIGVMTLYLMSHGVLVAAAPSVAAPGEPLACPPGASVSVSSAGELRCERDLETGALFRLAAFNVVSILTGTGYATADFAGRDMLWGPFAFAFFFTIMFVGGCAGSTACGIKIFRFQVLLIALRGYLSSMTRPHSVAPLRYAGRELPAQTIYSVLNFIFLFILSFAALAMAMAAFGLDTVTALSAAATAICNVGPGLGPVVGPAGNFANLPDAAKLVLAFGMLVGRLEALTVLVLFAPRFWRS